MPTYTLLELLYGGRDDMLDARESEDLAHLAMIEKTLAFHVSGHVLHSVFWTSLSPEEPELPEGELWAAIDDHFGLTALWHLIDCVKPRSGSRPPTCRIRPVTDRSWLASPPAATSFGSGREAPAPAPAPDGRAGDQS